MAPRPDFQIDFSPAEDQASERDLGWPPLVGSRGRVWCCGELLSYDAVEGDPALRRVLDDWEADNLRHERLNGRFVLIVQDATTHDWEIITDRVGAMHCYALRHPTQDGSYVQLGTDLRTLRSARVFDWRAIASLFAFGFFLDDRTYFTDVQILLPSSVYRFSADGGLTGHRRYWIFHHTPDLRRTYDNTLAQYDALLRQAVRRCAAQGRIVLPISGGLDSRSLAAMLPRDIDAYSYGYTVDSAEMYIASQIAAACGFHFTRHTIPIYLLDRLTEIVTVLHGSQDVTQARQMSVNAWVRARADAVLTGLWGDVWCDQMGLADGLPEGATVESHILRKFQKQGRAWLLENVSGPHLSCLAAEHYLADAVAEGLREFCTIADLDFRVKAYKTTHWAFRWSNASLRGFEPGAVPRIPYYDVDLIDFFCTVPTAWVRERRLQIDHLKRYAPHLARIRWQEADANLYLARYGYWLSLPRRALKKAHRILTRRHLPERNWEVQLLPFRERLSEALLQSPLTDLVDLGAVRALLDDFCAQPAAAHGYTVSMLLTFAAWLDVLKTESR